MNEIAEKYNFLLQDFIELLKEKFGDNFVSAILYGSVARGASRKDSDIDILLIFKTLPPSRHKRTMLVFPLIKALREKKSYISLFKKGYLPEVSPVIYTTEEIQQTKPVFLDIVEEGIIIIDDGTWETKKQSILRRMKELGSRKVTLGNREYYWIIKPGLSIGEKVVI